MKNVFSNENVNSGRQIELDFAKVFAILLMIVTHYFAFCTFGGIDYDTEILIIFLLCQCSAPILMFAMGIGMIYTRHNSPKEFIIRGIKLLILGLIVNTLYFLSNYGAGVPMEYALLSFLANDILQFAGISFILVGIFKKLNIKTLKIFLISILFSLIATYIQEFSIFNIYLNQLLGHFFETIGDYIVSCFPILNWFIVPACGMIFGEDLIRCKNKDELYKEIFKISGIMTVIMVTIGFLSLRGMFSVTGGTVPEKLAYLHISIPDIFILIIIALFLTSIFYFISKKCSSKIINFVERTSRNVTIIYIIQWVLILSLTYLYPYLFIKTNLYVAIIVLLLIIISSVVLAELYVKLKNYLKGH